MGWNVSRSCMLLIAACVMGIALSGFYLMRQTVSDPTLLLPDLNSRDVHPGRELIVRFPKRAPDDVILKLQTQDGYLVDLDIRRDESDRIIIARPVGSLSWKESYEFCWKSEAGFLSAWRSERRWNCSQFRTMSKRGRAGSAEAPILVIEGADRPFSRYYTEILKAEGLNASAHVVADDFGSDDLSRRSVVILDTAHVPSTTRMALQGWVQKGGLLLLMRPGAELRQEWGLSRAGEKSLTAAMMLPSPNTEISRGFNAEPLQVHGPIDSVPSNSLANSDVLAHLARLDGTTLPLSALSVVPHGRGHVADFAFDLSRSIVLSRQGNPAWINEDRDGSKPVRANDLFYPDFLPLRYAEVPMADELQRLLVNLIIERAPIPLPRFWYLPRKLRAALIMTGDDHATVDGTRDMMFRLDELSAPGCRVDQWECLRASSYLTLPTKFQRQTALEFVEKGFELGVHVDTGCAERSKPAAFLKRISTEFQSFRSSYPELPPQRTHRLHCIVWQGWVDVPLEERKSGIRLDLNYYLWPPDWIEGRQIFMNGSGFPMPYADLDGNALDVAQVATHLVNENLVPHHEGVSQLLDGALGPNQYFGAFATHFDYTDDYDQVLAEIAIDRGVPLISADQMLQWLDGRNMSKFSSISFEAGNLEFTKHVPPGAEGAWALLPRQFRGLTLSRIECMGDRVEHVIQAIKGLDMAFFPATSGDCTARYLLASSKAKGPQSNGIAASFVETLE